MQKREGKKTDIASHRYDSASSAALCDRFLRFPVGFLAGSKAMSSRMSAAETEQVLPRF
jgi:hypothetical protein